MILGKEVARPLWYHVMLCLTVVAVLGCGVRDAATLEVNKTLMRRWAEVEDQGNVEALDELAIPSLVFHYPGGAEIRGLDAVKENIAQSIGAFSGPQRQVEHEVAEGDLVATRFRFTGKHTGEYYGAAPTGNQIEPTFMSLCRISAGKLTECWVEFDSQTFSQQLGIGAHSEAPEET